MKNHERVCRLAAAWTIWSLAALPGCVALPATGQPGKDKVPMKALEGKTWVLAQLGDGGAAPAEPPVTLVFAEGKISGSSGCNEYFASAASPSPGALQVGAIGATKKACLGPVGEMEQGYFRALAKATRYSLEDGRLVLSWDREGESSPGRLTFKAGG